MTTAQTADDTLVETFEKMGMRTREATALENEFDSTDEIVEFLVADNKLSDISGVGRKTASRLWSWFKEEYPDRNRERIEASEAYCTEYINQNQDDSESDKFRFAFVCPRCNSENPLRGDPMDFANRPYDCTTCRWVPLLDKTAIETFVETTSEN